MPEKLSIHSLTTSIADGAYRLMAFQAAKIMPMRFSCKPA